MARAIPGRAALITKVALVVDGLLDIVRRVKCGMVLIDD